MTNLSEGRFVKPDAVVTHFHLREGDKVADFGAGSGFFLKALSELVGSEGRVYACEIQRGLVDKMGALVKDKRLTNVETLWCDFEAPGGTKLADGLLDAALLVNTLFQLENKEVALQEISRTIRKGGKLFVIDWSESFGGLGPVGDQVVDEMHAQSLVEAAGYTLDHTFDAGDHHYGLAFRRQ